MAGLTYRHAGETHASQLCAHRCGGSLAQCDVIHLTLTEAALRARQARLAHAGFGFASGMA